MLLTKENQPRRDYEGHGSHHLTGLQFQHATMTAKHRLRVLTRPVFQ